MYIQDGYESFLRNIDKFRVSIVTPEEFLHWYHMAQQDFVDQRCEYFELIGKFDDDISQLFRDKVYNNPSLASEIIYPEDYFRTALMFSHFSFTNDCDKTENVVQKVIRLTSDKQGAIWNNPYYRPNKYRWYYKLTNTGYKIYGDETVNISKIELTYVKNLPLFTTQNVVDNIDTIWKKNQLDKIASKAAVLFLENKQSQRVQTFPQVSKADRIQ